MGSTASATAAAVSSGSVGIERHSHLPMEQVESDPDLTERTQVVGCEGWGKRERGGGGVKKLRGLDLDNIKEQ